MFILSGRMFTDVWVHINTGCTYSFEVQTNPAAVEASCSRCSRTALWIITCMADQVRGTGRALHRPRIRERWQLFCSCPPVVLCLHPLCPSPLPSPSPALWLPFCLPPPSLSSHSLFICPRLNSLTHSGAPLLLHTEVAMVTTRFIVRSREEVGFV